MYRGQVHGAHTTHSERKGICEVTEAHAVYDDTLGHNLLDIYAGEYE